MWRKGAAVLLQACESVSPRGGVNVFKCTSASVTTFSPVGEYSARPRIPLAPAASGPAHSSPFLRFLSFFLKRSTAAQPDDEDVKEPIISVQTLAEGPIFALAKDTYTQDRPLSVFCGTSDKDVVVWEPPSSSIVSREKVCSSATVPCLW